MEISEIAVQLEAVSSGYNAALYYTVHSIQVYLMCVLFTKQKRSFIGLVRTFKQWTGSSGAGCIGNRLGKRESRCRHGSSTRSRHRHTLLLSSISTPIVFHDQLHSIAAQYTSACETDEVFHPRQRVRTEEAPERDLY
jgi:hypothetical protein